VLAAALLGGASCGRLRYDPLAPDLDASGSSGFGGAGFGGAGSGGAGGRGTGGGGGTVDAAAMDDAADDLLTPPNDSSAPPAMCSQAGTPTQIWAFDTGVDAWELSGNGTMIWTGATGDPAAGALQVDWSNGQTIHPRLVQPLGDLRGRIATVEVWVDAGTNVGVKLFTQTGTKLAWADGGQMFPQPGQWTCLALDFDNPNFSRQQYDASDVQILGLELVGSGASRVFIDELAY